MALPWVTLHPSTALVPQKKKKKEAEPLINEPLNVQYAGSFFKYIHTGGGLYKLLVRVFNEHKYRFYSPGLYPHQKIAMPGNNV